MEHQQQFAITGMHCASCVGKVKAALGAFAVEVVVTLKPPRVVLTGGKTGVAELNQALAAAGAYTLVEHETAPSWFSTYKPLLLVLAYLLLVTMVIQIASEQVSLESWMRHFMAGFFLVFSFFKLLDLRGFADSYASYDLLAMRWRGYGLIYPFIELGLGLAYLADIQHYYVNVITLVVMTFSSLGVCRALLNKQKIRCACLGAVFNLPMSTVTIVEDLLMVVMAGWMLI